MSWARLLYPLGTCPDWLLQVLLGHRWPWLWRALVAATLTLAIGWTWLTYDGCFAVVVGLVTAAACGVGRDLARLEAYHRAGFPRRVPTWLGSAVLAWVPGRARWTYFHWSRTRPVFLDQSCRSVWLRSRSSAAGAGLCGERVDLAELGETAPSWGEMRLATGTVSGIQLPAAAIDDLRALAEDAPTCLWVRPSSLPLEGFDAASMSAQSWVFRPFRLPRRFPVGCGQNEWFDRCAVEICGRRPLLLDLSRDGGSLWLPGVAEPIRVGAPFESDVPWSVETVAVDDGTEQRGWPACGVWVEHDAIGVVRRIGIERALGVLLSIKEVEYDSWSRWPRLDSHPDPTSVADAMRNLRGVSDAWLAEEDALAFPDHGVRFLFDGGADPSRLAAALDVTIADADEQPDDVLEQHVWIELTPPEAGAAPSAS